MAVRIGPVSVPQGPGAWSGPAVVVVVVVTGAVVVAVPVVAAVLVGVVVVTAVVVVVDGERGRSRSRCRHGWRGR